MSQSNSNRRIHYIHRLGQKARERLVGTFVLTALVILVALIFVNSRTTHFFEKKVYYVAYLKNAQGISTESVVNISGIEVGRVSDIDIADDHRIRLKLFVYERFSDLMRADSRASVSKLSMLGKAAIEISAGSPQKPQLKAGSAIEIDEPLSIDELIARFTPVVTKLEQIVDNTSAITSAINPAEVQSMSRDLAATAKNLRAITAQVASGKGTVGRLVYDRGMEQELSRSVTSLEAVLAKADKRVAELEPLVKNADGLMVESRALVGRLNTTVSTVNVELQQLPALVNRMQTMLDETNRTLEGVQNVWPISSTLPEGATQTVIEAQPAK